MSCTVSACFKIVSQKEGNKDYEWKFKRVFNADESNWGFRKFMEFKVIKLFSRFLLSFSHFFLHL